MAKAQARLAKRAEQARKSTNQDTSFPKRTFAAVDPATERAKAEERLAARRSQDLAKAKEDAHEQQERLKARARQQELVEQHELRRARIYAINHALQRVQNRKLAEYMRQYHQRTGGQGGGIEEQEAVASPEG